MKKIITYGTFDLFHIGHLNLLRRAKELGDYLIVAVSTDEFNEIHKNKLTICPYNDRSEIVRSIKYVDEVIPEESWDQKINDIKFHRINTFVIGADWTGKFDHLKNLGCEVIYLERTPEISSSEIKTNIRLSSNVR